jgi:hypothetical protein
VPCLRRHTAAGRSASRLLVQREGLGMKDPLGALQVQHA